MNRVQWFNLIAFSGSLITYIAEKLIGFFGGAQ